MIDQKIWDFALSKIDKNVDEIGKGYPHGTVDRKYELGTLRQWVSGFWPGILWQAFQITDNEKYAMLAREIEVEMDQKITNTEWIDHDNGFIWGLSAISDYRLTGNKDSRRRALLAANLLVGRFNVAGNFIRSWNDRETLDTKGLVIIDSVMNMPLLFWASEETGDPRFRHVAEAHLSTVIQYFFREDGSVAQTCVFDPETGEFIEEIGNQSYAEGSAWSRGAAWALYGFAIAARYTERPEFVDAAKTVANFFMNQLGDDTAPKWDFRAEADHGEGRILLDTSAAAIAACGMIELTRLSGINAFKEDAEKIINNLYEHHSTKDDPDHQGMLLNGTGHYPKQKNLEVSLVYGDYFFTEAVSSLLFDKPSFW